ncbi:small secreted protein [Streptomyces beijiangensis]|uniref:small secreted protein n=1 Tax=Streptomyces beijiangensis TaxID=163361 RepID=UPI0027DDA01D|nr:small secreted protein [Streptomyces beijiangensis]
MNKKLAAALSGGAVLVLSVSLSGCSSDDGNKKLDDWAKTLCGQIQPQLAKSTKANQQIVATAADGKPADIQKADAAAFQDLSDADKAIAAALTKAGAPPVDNGATLQQNAVKELNTASAAYAALVKQVKALDTGDQQKFADGLAKVSDGLDAINKSGSGAVEKLQQGDVGKALAKQPGCKVPTSSASPSASATKS